MTAKHVTSAQIRAARAMLGIDQEAVAACACVSVSTIKRAEAEDGGNLSKTTAEKIRSALEGLGIIFFSDGIVVPEGGAGVRLRAGTVTPPAVSMRPLRHLKEKTIISTQEEWERVRPTSHDDVAWRAFLREYCFDPSVHIVQATHVVDEAQMPRAGTIRRRIFDEALLPGRSIEEVNRVAKQIGGASVRTDADLFLGLFAGYVRLPSGRKKKARDQRKAGAGKSRAD